jgi:hypothetical protein
MPEYIMTSFLSHEHYFVHERENMPVTRLTGAEKKNVNRGGGEV